MSKGSVLLAEDDSATRTILSAVLKEAGYTPFAVASGEECLSLYNRVRPRAILLDIEMPNMNGLEVCKTIRQGHRDLTTPIIFVTAHGSRDDIARAMQLGGTYFIVKPFTPSGFLEKFERCLSVRPPATKPP
jgi:CheY-like chemotaxis protein